MKDYKVAYTNKVFQLILFFFLMVCINLQGQGSSIHIAPLGNDQHNGTKEKPVATVERANELVKAILFKQKTKDTIRVLFHEGVYRLSNGITLNSSASGTKDSPIIYQNYKADKVVISGSVPILDYSSISSNHHLYKKNKIVGSKIIEIDLTKVENLEFDKIQLSGFRGKELPENNTINELYFNGQPMPLSRWPNNGFTKFTHTVTDTLQTPPKTGIVYTDAEISKWIKEPNILLHGYWQHLWADAYEAVSEIDTAKKIIWLTPPYNHYLFSTDKPFAAYNVISEIDKPGEWAYDYQKKKIYFYPPEKITNGSLELSMVKTPLLQINDAQWITIKGLHFQMGAATGISINNSSNISILNCEVNGFVGEGIKINNGHSNTIAACHIYDMGRGAIVVSGGNRKYLEKANFMIDNCHIHNLSRIDRTYTPAIWVDGVGTTIKHCKIHDIPSSAMRINGNDHIIEYNEIHNVVTESDDQGAIDMWADPTYRGNIIRYNYFYDIGINKGTIGSHAGRAGVRLDDAISGSLVYSNIFKNASGGLFGAIQIHGGNMNQIWNNIFYQCSTGISFTPWTQEHWKEYTKESLAFFEKNRVVYIMRYPELKNIYKDLNKNSVFKNIFIETKQTTLNMPKEVAFKQNIEIDKNTKVLNLEKDNYALKSIQNTIDTIKFEPILFEKIGLRKN